MDAGTVTAADLPAWVYFALVGLGSLCGIFFMFVLGLLAKRNEGGGSNDEGVGGHRPDCTNCASIKELREENRAITSRVDFLYRPRGVE